MITPISLEIPTDSFAKRSRNVMPKSRKLHVLRSNEPHRLLRVLKIQPLRLNLRGVLENPAAPARATYQVKNNKAPELVRARVGIDSPRLLANDQAVRISLVYPSLAHK